MDGTLLGIVDNLVTTGRIAVNTKLFFGNEFGVITPRNLNGFLFSAGVYSVALPHPADPNFPELALANTVYQSAPNPEYLYLYQQNRSSVTTSLGASSMSSYITVSETENVLPTILSDPSSYSSNDLDLTKIVIIVACSLFVTVLTIAGIILRVKLKKFHILESKNSLSTNVALNANENAARWNANTGSTFSSIGKSEFGESIPSSTIINQTLITIDEEKRT